MVRVAHVMRDRLFVLSLEDRTLRQAQDEAMEPRFREQCDLYIFRSLSLSKIVVLTYLGQQCTASFLPSREQ